MIVREAEQNRRTRYRFYACLDNMLSHRLTASTSKEQPSPDSKSSHLFIAYEYDRNARAYEPGAKCVRTTGPSNKVWNADQSYTSSWLEVKADSSSNGGIGALAAAILEALGLDTRFPTMHDGRTIRRIAKSKGVPMIIHYGPQNLKYAKLVNVTPDLDEALDHIGTNDPYPNDTQR